MQELVNWVGTWASINHVSSAPTTLNHHKTSNYNVLNALIPINFPVGLNWPRSSLGLLCWACIIRPPSPLLTLLSELEITPNVPDMLVSMTLACKKKIRIQQILNRWISGKKVVLVEIRFRMGICYKKRCTQNVLRWFTIGVIWYFIIISTKILWREPFTISCLNSQRTLKSWLMRFDPSFVLISPLLVSSVYYLCV